MVVLDGVLYVRLACCRGFNARLQRDNVTRGVSGNGFYVVTLESHIIFHSFGVDSALLALFLKFQLKGNW
jgi:hypothetical protein